MNREGSIVMAVALLLGAAVTPALSACRSGLPRPPMNPGHRARERRDGVGQSGRCRHEHPGARDTKRREASPRRSRYDHS